MAVRITCDAQPDVQPRGMVLEIRAKEVGIHGMRDVGGDEEGVGVGAGDEGGDALVGEGVDDAFDDCGEEVGAGALAEEGADFFVVEETDDFDLGAAG